MSEMKTCCPGRVHAQIEYRSPQGLPVESLIAMDPQDSESRKLLHAMLNEWIDRRLPGEGADHFIVYGKWPAEDLPR